MKINVSIDIEEEIRKALSGYVSVYCRPLPEEYSLPHIEVQMVGGGAEAAIDTFEVVLDARAAKEDAALAYETLQAAIGILRQTAKEQTTPLRYVSVNTSGSWGSDPVRPDLELCRARLQVVAHQKEMEVIRK